MSEKKSHIKVTGKTEQEGVMLKPWNIQLYENGERIPRVQHFTFDVSATGVPLVTIKQLPESIELDLEGVEIHKELVNTRIFDECLEVLKTIDLEYRLSLHKGKNLHTWKIDDLSKLKGNIDNCYENFKAIFEQYEKGDRNILDVTVYASKIANYAIVLAERAYRIHSSRFILKK